VAPPLVVSGVYTLIKLRSFCTTPRASIMRTLMFYSLRLCIDSIVVNRQRIQSRSVIN